MGNHLFAITRGDRPLPILFNVASAICVYLFPQSPSLPKSKQTLSYNNLYPPLSYFKDRVAEFIRPLNNESRSVQNPNKSNSTDDLALKSIPRLVSQLSAFNVDFYHYNKCEHCLLQHDSKREPLCQYIRHLRIRTSFRIGKHPCARLCVPVSTTIYPTAFPQRVAK